jgi:hypothetical protein
MVQPSFDPDHRCVWHVGSLLACTHELNLGMRAHVHFVCALRVLTHLFKAAHKKIAKKVGNLPLASDIFLWKKKSPFVPHLCPVKCLQSPHARTHLPTTHTRVGGHKGNMSHTHVHGKFSSTCKPKAMHTSDGCLKVCVGGADGARKGEGKKEGE